MHESRDSEVVRTEGFEPGQGVPASAPAPALVLCEHASADFPARFGTLGLSEEARLSHAAWDPGALELARSLARHLGAPLVAAGVSRLLYDCNRPPDSPGAIREQSEIYAVPGNRDLDARARQARIDQIYRPFVAEVGRVLDGSGARALITMHTFTPVYEGRRREVEIGVLHDSDSRLADAVLRRTGQGTSHGASNGAPHDIRRNEPYGPADGVTHSLKIHGIARGIPNVMIEVRNDLVGDAAGLQRISAWLNPLLAAALADVLGEGAGAGTGKGTGAADMQTEGKEAGACRK